MPHIPKCISGQGNSSAAEPDRQLRANDREYNASFKYVDNYVKTSKYTLLSFLPINLFEQFQRVANIYFLLQIIIMSIPKITALNPESTAVPLVCVLAATAVKDAYDDIKRHRSDNKVNNRTAKVILNKSRVSEKWMKLQAGDVLRLDNDELVPADILLLTTSEENGLCYIETAELDGETNLKCRQPLPETAELGDDEEQLSSFNGDISCEAPNNRLDKFKGTLSWEGEEHSLDNENIVLRGCVMRNTQWVYGLVIFTGHDTKLMMNTGVSKFKRTGLDKLANRLIIWIAFLLAVICILCAIGTTIWEESVGKDFQIYLPWEGFYQNSVVIIGIVHWPSFVMVLNTLIPISLYISIEVIRLGQSLWINWDNKMYCSEKQTPARARTTTLTEELGQIQYIFSDKTGTLTQNVMTFKKCSIAGKLYGFTECADNGLESAASIREEQAPTVDFSDNPYADPNFTFHDPSLVDDIRMGNESCHEMFRLLALCHTVMVENTDDKLEYQAQSPDEAALVTAARNFGFVFVERSPSTITIKVMEEEEQYELLAILDFNNERKRMSVIVRRENKITLYCKGADSIVYERLDPSHKPLMTKTMEHLNMCAAEGLRTLVTASKEIPADVYEKWREKYRKASLAMEGRDELIEEAYEEIEQNLVLVGATAIEDKLQDGVPDAIATLAAGNIKIWVLTGDKTETAINIGYSCHLLTDDMVEVFIIDGDSLELVKSQIAEYRDRIQAQENNRDNNVDKVQVAVLSMKAVQAPSGSADVAAVPADESSPVKSGFGLVIPGKSLAFALHKEVEQDFLELACLCKAVIGCRVTPLQKAFALHKEVEQDFLELACLCKAVIGCRVTPLQKALVVELVKDNLKAVTLAIGDGANDVSMIKAAHIGVGISGQEGMQAVLASDYSFAQFRYLERLLLIHGRWSYMRMAKFLNYFFYKNFAFTLCQLWYAFFTGFSAQTLYDAWFISFYNVFFTSAPVVFMAVLDQDVCEESCIKFPKLYAPGQLNALFNVKVFVFSLLFGTATSLAVFFITFGSLGQSVSNIGLETSSQVFFGTAVAAILVVVVNIEICFMIQHWTWINHLFVWGSIIFYFVFYFIFYSEFVFKIIPQQHYYGVQFQVYGDPRFWLTMLLVGVVITVPSISFHFIFNEVRPSLSDIVRRQDAGKKTGVKLHEFHPRFIERKSSKRSSYAFSHQEGFGRIVTSPATFFRKKKWRPRP